MAAFHAAHPQVDLHLHTGTTAEVRDELLSGEVHLGMLHDEGEPLPGRFRSEVLRVDELVVILARTHALAQRDQPCDAGGTEADTGIVEDDPADLAMSRQLAWVAAPVRAAGDDAPECGVVQVRDAVHDDGDVDRCWHADRLGDLNCYFHPEVCSSR